jgi:hypothetical protein
MKYFCEFCELEYEFEKYQSFGAHKSNCIKNPNRALKSKKLKSIRVPRIEYIFNCTKCNAEYKLILLKTDFEKSKYKKYCSLSCSNSRCWSDTDKLIKSVANKNNIKCLNRMGVSHSEESKNKISKSLIKYHANNIGIASGRGKGRKLTDETRYKISNSLKGKTGGYRIGGGIGKHGWYKGYWCDSSWELAYVIYNIDHKIQFSRNTEKFDYEYNGKIKKFIPDFILPDYTYIEIKGYVTNQSINKIRDFKGKILVLLKKEMKVYLDYVINSYSKNFIEMYEN